MISIIAFANLVWRSSKTGSEERLARDLADRSEDEVYRRLKADLSRMSVAEMRGYVRARAAGILRRNARSIGGETSREGPLSDDVVSSALDRTVHMVMRRLMAQPQIPVLRRAAG